MLAKETQVKTRVQLWLIVYVSQYACGGRGGRKSLALPHFDFRLFASKTMRQKKCLLL